MAKICGTDDVFQQMDQGVPKVWSKYLAAKRKALPGVLVRAQRAAEAEMEEAKVVAGPEKASEGGTTVFKLRFRQKV